MVDYPPQYLTLNSEQTKQLAVAIVIDGCPDILTNVPIYSSVKYGDPGLYYGKPGLVYGALVSLDGVRPLIMVDQGLSLQQRIEPEQGRGAISTLSIPFLDKDGFMTQLVSPGVIVDELLGNKLCTIKLGYANSSFPEDYFDIFRGYVTSITSAPAKIILQFSDANVKRKQSVGFSPMGSLAASMTNVQTTALLNSAASLFDQIQDILGNYDPAVLTYLTIEDEVMAYGPGAIAGNTVTVTRAQRGTTAAAHASAEDVGNSIQLQDNCLTLALKIMLSGWNGPWVSDVVAYALGTTLDPLNPTTAAIVLNEDAVTYWGLTVGDQVIVSGSPSNDGSYIITAINSNANGSNRVLIIDTPLVVENPAIGTVAFRSKYDTLPVAFGSKQTPREVDVARHEELRANYFSSSIYRSQLYFTQTVDSAKSLIESQLFLPYGIYSVTRFGRISVGFTKPPLSSAKVVFLDNTTVIDPQNISIQRAVNTRRFFNIIQYQYDLRDDGTYASTAAFVDSASLTLTNVQQPLPIQANGVKTSLAGNIAIQSRANFLLNRYKRGAFEITLKVNWAVGSLIEVTDPVVLTDNGTLFISNFDTGERNIGQQLFEVIQRTINIKDGNVNLTLLSNIGATVGTRYATISPSSNIASGSTSTGLFIEDSYGALYPGAEGQKWVKFAGLPIRVHNADYSDSEEVTFTGFSDTNPNLMFVSPALSFTPGPGYTIEVGSYPATDTDPTTNALYKILYAFQNATETVTSGTSNFVFDVADGTRIQLNLDVIVHNDDYSIASPESKVVSVVGNTVTVETDLGFTPSAGQRVEVLGFADGQESYRFI